MDQDQTPTVVPMLGMDQICAHIQLKIKAIFDELNKLKEKAVTEEQKDALKNMEELFSGISNKSK